MYTEWERKSSYSIYDILDALFLRAFPYGIHSTGKQKFYIIYFTKLWFGKGFPFYGVMLTYADSAHL